MTLSTEVMVADRRGDVVVVEEEEEENLFEKVDIEHVKKLMQ